MPNIELETIARRIYKLGLTAPAIFFLEAFKPLTAVVHSATLVGAPLLQMCLGVAAQRELSEILRDRENIERLITLIEKQTEQKSHGI